MWESIKGIFTSENGITIACLIILLIIALLLFGIFLIKCGFLNIETKHIKLNNKSKISERELIRRQTERAYDFVMSIEGKLISDKMPYDKYFMKYVLERVYDKVIEWIMFNHITVNQLYIQDKQDTILNLIHSLPVNDNFKTEEFKNKVCCWVKELIEQLVNVKVLYGEIE